MRKGVRGLLGKIVIYKPTKCTFSPCSPAKMSTRDGAAGPLTVNPRRFNLYQSNLDLIKSPHCCKQNHSAVSLANGVKFDLPIVYGGGCDCEGGWREYLTGAFQLLQSYCR